MAQGTVMPAPRFYGTDANGAPLASGKLYTYTAGTSTPVTTYSDSLLTTPNANPVILDSAGRAIVYLTPGVNYKFVLKDSADATIYTQDNISATPTSAGNVDITGTAGQGITAGQVCYLSDGSGGQTAGLWYLADADNLYSSSTAGIIAIAPNAISLSASGSFRVQGEITGLGGLTVGANYYVSATAGALTSTAPTNVRFVGVASSTTTLAIGSNTPIPATAGNVDISGTAGTTITAGQMCYIADGTGGTTAGRWYQTDADAASSSTKAGVVAFAVNGLSTGSVGLFRTQGVVTGLSGLTAGLPYYISATAGAITASAPTRTVVAGTALSTTTLAIGATPRSVSIDNTITGGRLTLTSGTPVTTADVTAATTVYFAPYRGNRIALYDGAAFNVIPFSETSLALGTVTSGLPYDIFGYDTGGGFTLEKLAWTNATTRATALALQDGVLVKTGDTTRRFLGCIFTTSTTTTEDSYAKRLVQNYDNRVDRPCRALEATNSWAYTTAAYRQANASTANQIAIMVGWPEDGLEVSVQAYSSNFTGPGPANRVVSIGEDSTTTPATGVLMGFVDDADDSQIMLNAAALRTIPAVGYHYYTWLEYAEALGTTTWYGDANTPTILQSGIHGMWRA